MKYEKIDLFKEYPKYKEYADKYLENKDPSRYTIIYLFKKYCGETGILNPLENNIRDKILTNLEQYGFLGENIDIKYRKWLYKHTVNMYKYVNGQEDSIIPIVHWANEISI